MAPAPHSKREKEEFDFQTHFAHEKEIYKGLLSPTRSCDSLPDAHVLNPVCPSTTAVVSRNVKPPVPDEATFGEQQKQTGNEKGRAKYISPRLAQNLSSM